MAVIKRSAPEWSGLYSDMLAEIATKLKLIEDFTAFRGVCTSWRAAAAKDRFVSVSKLPLLMLPEKDADGGNTREFYSLCKKKVFTRIPVPEAKGKRCIEAGFGWILTEKTCVKEPNLVNPISSAKIQLPSMDTFPGVTALLSENPSTTSDFMLMVIVKRSTLGFWRNGDDHWTKLEVTGKQCFQNVGYYKQKVYAIDDNKNVWTWDPSLPAQAPEILLKLQNKYYFMDVAYFVESSKGELLLITSKVWDCSGTYMMHPVFIRIDTVNRTYGEIRNLGQDAVFTGRKYAVSVSADDFPGVVKENCIYFTHRVFGDNINIHDYESIVGIYNAKDGITEMFGAGLSGTWVFPPL